MIKSYYTLLRNINDYTERFSQDIFRNALDNFAKMMRTGYSQKCLRAMEFDRYAYHQIKEPVILALESNDDTGSKRILGLANLYEAGDVFIVKSMCFDINSEPCLRFLMASIFAEVNDKVVSFYLLPKQKDLFLEVLRTMGKDYSLQDGGGVGVVCYTTSKKSAEVVMLSDWRPKQ